MKKIFAIALALVMVLSMASAFAFACTAGFDWTCSTSTNKCGKATVEVVSYVKTNAACDDYSFVESDCAAAINGENVYYALKLTVDEDIDLEWWATASIEIEIDGMTANTKGGLPKPDLDKYDDDEEDGWEFYYANKRWNEVEEDGFKLKNVISQKVVEKYADAEVCLTLKAASEIGSVRVGDFTVRYQAADAEGVAWLAVYDKDNEDKLVTYKIKDEKVVAINYTSVCGEATYETIKAFMGLEIGTCVTDEAVEANFGWDDEFESCFAWSDKGASVVNPECVVAIPKTGDASVLAWLF